MNITLTVPDAQAARLRDNFCEWHNYDATKLENETKAQFVQRKTREWVKECVSHNEVAKAAAAAQASAAASVESETQLT